MVKQCCSMCGDLGFGYLLKRCRKCRTVLIHEYCMKQIQLDIGGHWKCENCRESKNTTVVQAASRSHSSLSKGGRPSKDNLNASKREREQKLIDGQLIMINRYLPNHPASLATWKGMLKIDGFAFPFSSDDDLWTVWGYPPAKVGSKAYEFLKEMPGDLDLKAIPRSTVWASDQGPDKHDIGLYFLPHSDKSVQCYYCLVAHFEKKDIVLERIIKGIQLLIFSSSCLEEPSKKINQAYYLWGLFVPSAVTFKEPEIQQLPSNTNAEPAAQEILKIEETGRSIRSEGCHGD